MKIFKTIAGFFKYSEINPSEQAKSLNKTLFWTKRVATLAVAVVSGIAAAVYGWDLAGRYTEWTFLKGLSGTFFFAVSTYVTDIVLTDLIQQSSFDFLVFFNLNTYKQTRRVEYVPELGAKYDRFAGEKNKKGVPVFTEGGREYAILPKYDWFQRGMQVLNWILITALIGGLFWFDYSQVRIAIVPIANIARQQKTINFDSTRNALILQEDARVSTIDAAILEATKMISSLSDQIEQTKKQVERNNPVLDGIDHGKKNGWELQKLAELKASATSDLRSQLKDAIVNKNELIRQRIKAEAYKNDVIAKSDTLILSKNQEIEAGNKALVLDTSEMLFWIGFGLKILIGMIEIILVVRFLANNPVDANGDGEINHKDVNAGFLPG